MFIACNNNCTSFVKIPLVAAFRKAALNFNPFILRVIMESQCKVVLTFEFVDKMMWHYHSNRKPLLRNFHKVLFGFLSSNSTLVTSLSKSVHCMILLSSEIATPEGLQ